MKKSVIKPGENKHFVIHLNFWRGILDIKNIIPAVFLLFLSNTVVYTQCPSGLSSSGLLNSSYCAPSDIGMFYEFASPAPMPQTSYRIQFIWGDGVTKNVTQSVQTRIVGGVTIS